MIGFVESAPFCQHLQHLYKVLHGQQMQSSMYDSPTIRLYAKYWSKLRTMHSDKSSSLDQASIAHNKCPMDPAMKTIVS